MIPIKKTMSDETYTVAVVRKVFDDQHADYYVIPNHCIELYDREALEIANSVGQFQVTRDQLDILKVKRNDDLFTHATYMFFENPDTCEKPKFQEYKSTKIQKYITHIYNFSCFIYTS